jgi:hypothetical protein
LKEWISGKIKKYRLKQAIEAQNANREKQEKWQKLLKSGTIDGVISTIVKPHANQLKNLSTEARQAKLD